MKQLSMLLGLVLLGTMLGCATGNPSGADALKQSAKPAWSLKSSQDEMIVATSPMRKTLQLAGSTGLIVGFSVDLVINSDYRDAVRQALNGYNTEEVFRSHVEQRLRETLPNGGRVQPLQSAAGYANEQEARQARYRSLAREGYDAVLDLRSRYGLFGTNVQLVTELDADLIAVPSGKKLWSTTVFATPEPALASDSLGNPQKKKRSSESAPQFSVDKAAFARWTANNGEKLRAGFENGVKGVTDALLAELGLVTSAQGELYLGRIALSREDFTEAKEHFEAALRIDPTLVEALSAQSVNYAQAGQVDIAVQLAQGITKSHPDFAPAWYNLAWWHAFDLDDPAAAKPFYAEAQRLGLPPDAKLEKAFQDQ
ncbi:MAG: tetratricopeptide repeat protein [FCB group bacterium]|jgi:tetratricopeptide (TPR) repeat protein|nr:tetratricopeptide repeat protein [FCB group bacterium]